MQEIELTLEELPDFESFLKEPGVKILEQQETENYRILICNTNQKFIIPKQDDNILIYGKDKTERIVSIEVEDDKLIIFKLDRNGKIITEIRNNEFWLLSPRRLNSKQLQLKGNQYYKFMSKFNNREDFELSRKMNWKFDCYSIYNPKEAAMVLNGITYFKELAPSEIPILSFDIETTGIAKNASSKVLLISNTFRDAKGNIERKLFSFDEYVSPKEMIEDWTKWVLEKDPSIITGHNIMSFDLPYLNHIAQMNDCDLKLGRTGLPIQIDERVSHFRKDGSQSYEYNNINIYGRELIDSFFLSIKFDIGRKYESYGLKQIIKQEGKERPESQSYDASKIKDNYIIPEEWEKIKVYCERDSDDALVLYDMMSPSFFYMARSIPKSFQMINNTATGSQINAMMVRGYLQQGHSIAKADDVEGFEGAISFGVPGLYKNVYKLDIAALYPSIMRQYKIYNKSKDPQQHFLKMVEYFTKERLKNKKLAKETNNQYYKDLEQSQKILINSKYGTLGSPGLNYNSPRHAAIITKYGREILAKGVLFATGKDISEWKKLSSKDEENNEKN